MICCFIFTSSPFLRDYSARIADVCADRLFFNNDIHLFCINEYSTYVVFHSWNSLQVKGNQAASMFDTF